LSVEPRVSRSPSIPLILHARRFPLGLSFHWWTVVHIRINNMKKFYGLTGTKLNVAIAVIAGTDFALFGYGTLTDLNDKQKANVLQIKV
jgi:hypothetical protein